MEKAPEAAVTQLPAWETPAGFQPKSVLPEAVAASSKGAAESSRPSMRAQLQAFSATFAGRCDRYLPPHKTYTPAKLKRRTFLLALAGILLALLALILGLSIGLTRKNGRARNLPLPNGAEVYHGDLTYYAPGLGACGVTSSDSDNIVAIAHDLFDSQSRGSDPNANPLCGKMLRAQRFDSRVGKIVSLDLKVVDRCVGCQPTDLDVSPGAFDQLADPDLGRVHDMSWAWV